MSNLNVQGAFDIVVSKIVDQGIIKGQSVDNELWEALDIVKQAWLDKYGSFDATKR